MLCHGLDWMTEKLIKNADVILDIILYCAFRHDWKQCLGFGDLNNTLSFRVSVFAQLQTIYIHFLQDKSLSPHVLSCSSGSSSTASHSSEWLSSQTVKNGRSVLQQSPMFYNSFLTVKDVLN